MFKKTLFLIFLSVLVIGLGFLYGGIVWCAAWVLQKAIDVNVNYAIFVWVAVGIYVLKVTGVVLAYIYSLKKHTELKNEILRARRRDIR